MVLQSSGAISLANIQTEFGGSNPISINEYYAGGSFVPSGTTGVNGAVPSSGQISFSQFYGTSSVVVELPVSILINADNFLVTNQAILQINSNGKYNEFTSDFGDLIFDWIIPNEAAGNAYEARVTDLIGTLTQNSGVNTWLGLGTLRQWGIQTSSGVDATASFTIEIRNASSGTVLTSSSVSLSIGVFDSP